MARHAGIEAEFTDGASARGAAFDVCASTGAAAHPALVGIAPGGARPAAAASPHPPGRSLTPRRRIWRRPSRRQRGLATRRGTYPRPDARPSPVTNLCSGLRSAFSVVRCAWCSRSWPCAQRCAWCGGRVNARVARPFSFASSTGSPPPDGRIRLRPSADPPGTPGHPHPAPRSVPAPRCARGFIRRRACRKVSEIRENGSGTGAARDPPAESESGKSGTRGNGLRARAGNQGPTRDRTQASRG